MSDQPVTETLAGDGYAVTNLDALGDGPGFRKIRSEIGVTAFGANALVLPPSYTAPPHYHDTQEELYFVHSGTMRLTIGEETHLLGPGGLARVDAPAVRRVGNASDTEELVVLAIGGKDGYVGRDGRQPDGDSI
ncbi:MAG: cupin domain-containing protein [Actinomycetes bacterium]